MTSSVAAVDTSPYILLEEVEAGIRKNYETTNKCAFETGRLYVDGRELCKDIGKDFDEWIDENTPYKRGHAYRLINVFERFKNPKYIHLVPQIQDSGQMKLAQPKLKYATEILDYIVENIATEIDPKKKRLTHDRVQEIIYREQARIHAEREGAKPPPTQEDEELRDLAMARAKLERARHAEVIGRHQGLRRTAMEDPGGACPGHPATTYGHQHKGRCLWRKGYKSARRFASVLTENG